MLAVRQQFVMFVYFFKRNYMLTCSRFFIRLENVNLTTPNNITRKVENVNCFHFFSHLMIHQNC